MRATLRYGVDGQYPLDLDAESVVGNFVEPQGQPIDDVSMAVEAAVEDPIGFPPLREIVLSDDRVVIPLERGLACAPQLLSGLISQLVRNGLAPECISVLRAKGDRVLSPRRLLSELDATIRDRITVLEHDPNDRQQLCFLTAGADDRPLLINRNLVDADVVLPLGMVRAEETDSSFVDPAVLQHASWFPAFADHDTRRQFHRSLGSSSKREFHKRQLACEQAAAMLGVQFVVQLVPTIDAQALYVLAGAPDQVWREAQARCEGHLRYRIDRRASLVVAAVDGGPEQQTWDNVSRAIHMALPAVADHGAIAVCCDLRKRPGPAISKLRHSEDPLYVARAIRRKSTADVLSARRLNEALQRTRVYLLSQLDEEQVESLGMAYVGDAREIATLTSRHESCLLLGGAQHVALQVDGEI